MVSMLSPGSPPRVLSLPVGLAALSLPAVLWHGDAVTTGGAAIMALAIIALMLAPRRAAIEAQTRFSAQVAEIERAASARVRTAPL